MTTPINLLCVEDSPHDLELIQESLRAAGIECSVQRVDKRRALADALSRSDVDLILSDFSLPGYDGLLALEMARRLRPDVPFIFVSGTIGEEVAVESLKRGAVDYVLKNRLDRLPAAVRRALREVAEQRKREQAESRSRELAELLDKARDAICLKDLDQRILYWNEGAEQLYGWTAEEAVGRNANDLLFGGDVSASLEAVKSLMARGEWRGERQQATRDGRKIVTESRWTLRRDESGRPVSILVINTDVTEKKKIEAEFLRAQRLESIGALSGGIAHDLNNVLSPILMASDLLQARVPEGECREMLELIKSSAHRGSELVRQILSFARGAAGKPQAVQIRHLIQDMAKLVRDTFPRSISVRTRFDRDLRLVLGDATQFQQLFLNLCVNARDAMSEGGELRLEAANVDLSGYSAPRRPEPVSGPFLVATVSDSGVGIPASLMGRIFEPFFTTKESGKGTGLGLSTVLSIVDRHEGFLEIESRPGRGTTFKVFLPALESGEETKKVAESPAVPPGRGERILLVDDEVVILEITRETLEYFGYNVLAARHGAEALSIYQQRRDEIDLVVTDMMMPVMDGAALITALKEIDPDVRVVCVTGLGSSYTLSGGEEVIRGFLTKPYPSEKLLTAVRAALEG